jgi:SAM-dependent methyltransferase
MISKSPDLRMPHLRKFTNLLPQPVRFGLRKLLFSGSALSCVLCGNSVRFFNPHGGGAEVLERRQVVGGMRREADACPICHGCDRTRMMMLYLSELGGIGREPRHILHIAPDLGLYLWLKRQPDVSYVGSDIDKARYRHIQNIHTADLTAAPFGTDTFDIVICSHVLEHIPDDAKAMREMLRILRAGGVALLLVPLATDGQGTDEDPSVTSPSERHRRFGQWDHVRLYDRDDFLARVAAAGFETSVFYPFESYPEEAEALRLNPLEILVIGRKPTC